MKTNHKSEAEMFRSFDFVEALRKQIEKDTWDIGLPMIGGLQVGDRYEIRARYKDGRIELRSYMKNGATFVLKDENGLEAFWTDLYSCKIMGTDEEKLFAELKDRRYEFEMKHKEYEANIDERDMMD